LIKIILTYPQKMKTLTITTIYIYKLIVNNKPRSFLKSKAETKEFLKKAKRHFY
jgi:hypothetical protein